VKCQNIPATLTLRALPLSPDGLATIGYAGVVSVTRLTPSGKIAKAIAKKRAAA
jgi:hypothetical protein